MKTAVAIAAVCWAWPAAAQERLTLSPTVSTGGLREDNLEGNSGRSRALDWSAYRSPAMALGLSVSFTVAPVVAGATMAVWAYRHNTPVYIAGLSSVALGLAFRPGVGYAYAGEHARGWGGGALRLVSLVAGALAVAAGSFCMGCQEKDETGPAVVGVTLLTGIVAWTIYDIAKSPDAARRTNAKHGLANLSLVPVVAADGSAALQGLALAGRF